MDKDSFQSYGPQRQREVFFGKLLGDSSDIPFQFFELEEQAREVMDRGPHGYVAGNAGSETTTSANRNAFSKWKLRPRLLQGVEERKLKTGFLEIELHVPLLLAPVGVQSIIHDRGARASAEGAARLGVPFIHSTVSSHTIEDIADNVEGSPLWFQLYWSDLPELNESLIQRAEEADYEAIVVTLDSPLLGWRPRDLEQGYFPFLDGEGLANYTSDPCFRDKLDIPPEESMDESLELFLDIFSKPSAQWSDLRDLSETTNLPFLAKGILHPDDATKALEHGCDGIIVSNHGGRHVDGEMPALDALVDVRNTLPEDDPILFDSGVRSGTDVLKACALGADAVLLGRPYLYALALEGADGVEELLKNYLAELDITMGLCGEQNLAEVSSDILVRGE